MLTTPADFLAETSQLLNESATDTSVKRIGYFNRAMRRVKRMRKWSWNKKSHTLSVSAGVQSYDLTSVISDYNLQWGIYEVYIGGEKVTPSDYSRLSSVSGTSFGVSPDGKTITFTNTLDGSEDVVIWYSPRHTKATASDSTLSPSVPEDMLGPVCLLMKSYVHDGKRQRNDARNALLDFKEEIEEAILQDSAHKIKDLPHTLPNPLVYNRVRRTYRF